MRVYPSVKFVSYYERELGQDLSVGGTQGEVQTGYRAQRVEIPFAKSLPGAIVGVDTHEGMPLLWVTFDPQCASERCALGFVLSHDQLYRLVHVPRLAGLDGLIDATSNLRAVSWTEADTTIDSTPVTTAAATILSA